MAGWQAGLGSHPPQGFPGLADRQGLSLARLCLRVAATRPQRIAKISQRLSLAVAVTQLTANGEAVPLAGDRLSIPAQQPVKDAEVAAGVRLGGQIVGAAGKLEGRS